MPRAVAMIGAHLAVALILALGIAHSYLGERYILRRLFRREELLPKLFGTTAFTAGTLRFVWHLTTVAWFGIAAVIVQAANPSVGSGAVLRTFAVLALASGLFPLWFTRGKHLSWVVFFGVAALLGWASVHV